MNVQNKAANNSNCFLTPFYIHQRSKQLRSKQFNFEAFPFNFFQQFSLIKKSNNGKKETIADCFVFFLDEFAGRMRENNQKDENMRHK